jgi:hypothetical protein
MAGSAHHAGVTPALPRGLILAGMRNLDDLTRDLATLDKSGAFLVCALASDRFMGDPRRVDDYFAVRPGLPRQLAAHVKSAVTAIDTSSGLLPARPLAQAFLEGVSRRSVLGQLGAPTVSGHVTIGQQSASATASWVGEGVAKPLTAAAFTSAAMRSLKLVVSVIASEELMELAVPNALGVLQRLSQNALASALDTALLDPTNAGTANTKPASLTNGLTPITPASDFQNQVGQVLAGISDGSPTRPVLIASLQTGLRLQALRDLADLGVKLVISPAAGPRLIAVDADGLVVFDDGITASVGTPDVEMSDTPANPSTASTIMVSTWQRDLAALKLERFVNWAKRADAVSYLTLA